ncbi:MAG: 4-aminobutyrate--2-oxoglutarate transaminase [Desulfarculaceae bacterium]|nr:4-aminobutyrate--2-oxoglutarate transaminase [Desulfarculaceae bacterium]MCF8073182.1 4-aminobutyrate--2-oxoglutarate transaminase [Desulfarculaceae bacterium]MCF8100778.1 4-aminobutyrate--2-oxoglutarate transaminase [Desulfarculaceae bacterium]MCF8118425.1 4-aminobutyrate--2-oxoglutarate transaminase [Desulfarculaceae bacterium]
MSLNHLWDRRAAAIPRGVGNVTPVVMAKAEGALIWDPEGNQYIDFAGGIGVNNVGHRHPKVVAAIKKQADQYLHGCFHVSINEPYVALAEKLNDLVPCRGTKKTMFANSGAEAVENAVKIARYATGRTGVVCFEGAFHGRTLLGMALTSKVMPYKYKLGAHLPGIYRAPAPYCYRCPWGREYPGCGVFCGQRYLDGEFFKYHVSPDEVAVIIMEPVLGEGGFIVPPPEYWAQLRQLCDDHGIVLVADEVQTGIARTGKMFALEHFGVEADIVTTGKSLGGGLPLSGITGTAELMDSVHPGGLGGTYGGNPVACAAGLAVLEVIEQEDILTRAEKLGTKARQALLALQDRFPVIGDVRGLGPMLAFELVSDPVSKQPAAELAKKLTAYCHAHGLLILDCGTLGNNVRTLMPLVITDEQFQRGINVLTDGMQQLG